MVGVVGTFSSVARRRCYSTHLAQSSAHLVGELVPRPGPPAGQVPHVLEHRVEDEAGLLPQLVLVGQLLEQRLPQGVTAVAPKIVEATLSGAEK